MIKRTSALALALLFVLSACTPQASGIAAEIKATPVQTDVVYEYTPVEDAVFTMIYDPRPDGGMFYSFGLEMPDNFDSDWLTDSEFDSHYNIFDAVNKTQYATVRVQTAPPDPYAYYKTQSDAEVLDYMTPKFFPTEGVYTGLKKAVVEDFEYDLVADWTGTTYYDWKFFYLEFIDQDSKNHALRFYMCNDKLNEEFFALEYKADLPMDDTALIDKCRAIIFSMAEF